MKIEMYTKNYCPFCISAKHLLKSKNVIWEEINLSEVPERFDEMKRRAGGLRTVPQIFIDGKYISDCQGLHRLESMGKLDELLTP